MNLKVSQQVTISVEAEDKFGNKTGEFASPPTWGLTDPSLGKVVAAADGLSAVVSSDTGKLGATQLQVLGTADGKTLEGDLDLNFIPGDAVKLVLSAGAPVDPPASA